MLGKLVIALLLVALVVMTLKFFRERERRLRERARDGEKRRAGVTGKQSGKTVTLKKDPETGVYRPDDANGGDS
ncbi:MAG TPA: hypothetical protein ENK15_07135 [Thermopetrobacter sp.]|nr:hypothetical protein [Thermopetrobacter sp.]